MSRESEELRAKLRAVIEAGERASARPWKTDASAWRVYSSPYGLVAKTYCQDVIGADANFIVVAGNSVEALARFALAVIDHQCGDNMFLSSPSDLDRAVGRLIEEMR